LAHRRAFIIVVFIAIIALFSMYEIPVPTHWVFAGGRTRIFFIEVAVITLLP